MNLFARTPHRLLVILCALVLSFVLTPARSEQPQKSPATATEFKNLKYRLIGPWAGGRVCRVAGVPGDPLVYYAATASGGLWKSSDGGNSWKPIFDDQPTCTVGAVAVAPSDPNVIYAGSGEANIRSNVVLGNGVYKSIDGGKTWTHVWKARGQIGTVIVHPTNPNIAFVAMLGSPFGPNPHRGVYRTIDGGKTWGQVLTRSIELSKPIQFLPDKDQTTEVVQRSGEKEDIGASDVCFDPSNPNIIFAGLWQTRRRPWELTSGGPGSGLYVSRDGGDTWKQLKGNGLPDGIWGKVGVQVAPSDGRRVYALIEAEKGGLYRSDDGGEKWTLASKERNLVLRPWYYMTFTIDPTNADVLWVCNIPLMKSIDGGKTFNPFTGPHHGDFHDVWIDPKNPKRMIVASDGGVDITLNSGETWHAPPLPITQFYHINVDSRTPYHVSGTMQDLGSAAGPSNSLSLGGIVRQDWYSVGGGETGYTAHDPKDPNIVYAGEYGGYISRFDFRTRTARNISVWPNQALGHAAGDLKYRFRWPAPLLLSPHDSRVLYHASNILFRTTDEGKTWTAISPDLTRNDRTKQQWSGGPITGDNTSAEYYCTISALAESPKQKDVLWVGSDDGLVHVSQDGGKNWTNVTANIPGLPQWATVKAIEASPYDAGTAYVVGDAHLLNDTRPFLWMTKDFGKTWQSLTATLPKDVYLHVVREDPKQRGVLYLGTERGVSLSTDGGKSWRELRLNLPTVPVHDLVVKDDDLVVGTHGRSIWILDDLTPIRERGKALAAEDFYLFTPRPAVRWNYRFARGGRDAGENPPPGAILHYLLKAKVQGPVTLTILDAEGKTVRTLSSKPAEEAGAAGKKSEKPLPAETGMHRFVWDMTYTGPATIKDAKLRGPPLSGPTVPPGTYTVKLSVGGKEQTATLQVRPDPRSVLPAADLAEQLKFALQVRDDVTQVAETVNQLQTVREQLRRRNELLKENKKAAELIRQSQSLIKALDDLEDKLYNAKLEVPNDIIAQKGGVKLYARLVYLFNTARTGEGAPTQGMIDVRRELLEEFRQYTEEWQRRVEELSALNDMARRLDLLPIVSPPAK
jgi:photosystem II stability/assembly factor-like uncharacterized protein